MKTAHGPNLLRMRLTILGLLASTLFLSAARAQAPAAELPVFRIDLEDSSVKFFVKATVKLEGSFEKWDSTLTFTSREATTGVLNIMIQADSVKTGSGMKDGKLKSKDFFNAKEDPIISFKSTKLTQTGVDTFVFDGDFTIRGVTRHEQLKFTVVGKGTGDGKIDGVMAFDRKDYAMDKGIPFIKIADRVEVTVHLRAKQVSGPRLLYQQ